MNKAILRWLILLLFVSFIVVGTIFRFSNLAPWFDTVNLSVSVVGAFAQLLEVFPGSFPKLAPVRFSSRRLLLIFIGLLFIASLLLNILLISSRFFPQSAPASISSPSAIGSPTSATGETVQPAGTPDTSNPQRVLSQFCSDLQSGMYQDAYHLLADQTQHSNDFEQFKHGWANLNITHCTIGTLQEVTTDSFTTIMTYTRMDNVTPGKTRVIIDDLTTSGTWKIRYWESAT